MEEHFELFFGKDWENWAKGLLSIYIKNVVFSLGRSYSRDEALSHAYTTMSEYVDKVLTKVIQEKESTAKTRSYVCVMAANGVKHRLREEDSLSGIYTPQAKRLRSASTIEAADRAYFAVQLTSSTGDDIEIGAMDFDSSLSIPEHMLSPEDILLRHQNNKWTELACDLADAFDEARDHAMYVMPKRDAVDARILLQDKSRNITRVNTAWMITRVLYEFDRRELLMRAPAMASRWMYSRNTPKEILNLISPDNDSICLRDVFEDDARRLVKWLRSYADLSSVIGRNALNRVVIDAGESTDGWRGSYIGGN